MYINKFCINHRNIAGNNVPANGGNFMAALGRPPQSMQHLNKAARRVERTRRCFNCIALLAKNFITFSAQKAK